MNKYVLFVVVLASLLTVGLYTRPKVVVRNDSKQLGSANPSGRVASGTQPTTSGATVDRSEIHEAPMTPEQQQHLNGLRMAYLTATAPQQTKAADELIDAFRQASRYDSAAHYAGLVAKSQPTESNLLRAGDQYFEAYTFAVDEAKTAALGQQTRQFYQQVLDKNPNLLAAKANMAMTYVNTDNPMQGIALLRSVLQQDPNNELALFSLGMLSMRSNQYGRAVDRFRQILVNNPTSRKAKFYLGVSLAESGQKAEAKQVLAEVKTGEKDPQILAAIREYEDRLK
jgi:predicted Zn-dependent protease